MLKNFEKNIVPLIPKGLKLVNVTTQILDKMTKALYKTGKTSGTIKVIIYSFSIPLKEAYRLGLILHLTLLLPEIRQRRDKLFLYGTKK